MNPKRFIASSILLILGYLALCAGLVALQRTFYHERSESVARGESHLRTLELYARSSMQEHLDDKLRGAMQRMDDAEFDPLLPSEDLFLWRDGTRLLPRPIKYRDGLHTGAIDLYIALMNPDAFVEMHGFGGAERAALLRSMQKAETQDETQRLAELSLELREGLRLPASLEIPYMLAFLDSYLAQTNVEQVDRHMLQAIVRDEFDPLETLKVGGLQRELIKYRDQFTRSEFEFLRDTILRISMHSGALYKDFELRSSAEEKNSFTIQRPVDEETLSKDGDWYLIPDVDGSIVGTRVDAWMMLDEIQIHMSQTGLLEPTESLEMKLSDQKLNVITNISLFVQSKRWQREKRTIANRYHWKTLLNLFCAGLGLAIVGLGLLTQYRKTQLLELQTSFVATVSHELRTPLASVRLLAETLDKKSSSDTTLNNYSRRIIREIDRLTLLVDNVLSFGSLRRGRWNLKPSEVDVQDLLQDIKEEIQEISAKPVRWTFSGLDECRIFADPELVRLLFINLARNACLYNQQEATEIQVNAEQKNGRTLWFRDNGAGIDPTEKKRVFDDFYRPKHKEATRIQGSGLGLAICRRVMHLHGGSINIETSNSSGTTFRIFFPERTT